MFVTIINDCNSDNAFGRQATRAAALFDCAVNTVSVPVNLGVAGSINAAGNLIDMLDAAEGAEGVILVNAAPRNGSGKKWKNGTPFGYFYYGKTLVVASVDGSTLSLIKKFNLTDTVHVMDIPTVLQQMSSQVELEEGLIERITNTQFRSLDFVPRVARWLWDKKDVPAEAMSIDEIDDAPPVAWLVDSFGNVKTTLVADDVDFRPGETCALAVGDVPCYQRLKDVPDGEPALIVGSSGLGDTRFLELVVQGQHGGKHFGLSVGDRITQS